MALPNSLSGLTQDHSGSASGVLGLWELFFFLNVCEHACLSVHPAAFIGCPGAEVTRSCAVPCGCLELNLDALDT